MSGTWSIVTPARHVTVLSRRVLARLPLVVVCCIKNENVKLRHNIVRPQLYRERLDAGEASESR